VIECIQVAGCRRSQYDSGGQLSYFIEVHVLLLSILLLKIALIERKHSFWSC
jgi:hypothetical protein